jgi:hypothetical protein
MNAAPAAPGLIFHWPLKRLFTNALPLFVAASLLLHAAGFVLFQIVYPPALPILAPPPDVRLFAANEENRAFLEQIEAEDPARFLSPPQIPPPAFRRAEYSPSFASVQTLPKKVLEESQPIRALPILDPNSLVKAALPRSPLANPSPVFRPSTIEIAGPLGERFPTDASSIVFNSTTILQSPAFLLGVDQDGRVRYLFLQRTSGEDSVDRRIEAKLKTLQFGTGTAPLMWGVAKWIWGSAEPDSSSAPAE